MIKTLVSTVAAAIAVCVIASPAHAVVGKRIWVSGHGVDQAGCGTLTAPCRSLQYAHDTISSGGEIDIVDPAEPLR
jgi:hypothetical protein